MFPFAFLACLLVGKASAALPANFQNMSAVDKQTFVWNLLLADKYPPATLLPRSNASSDPLGDPQFLTLAFGQELDEMPAGRPKIVGTNGITAKGEFRLFPNSTYTGVFKAGSSNTAILRISANTGENLVTFFAMKVYVDGQTSQNFHSLHDVLGWNVDIDVVDLFEWSLQTGTPAPTDADFTSGRYSAPLNTSFTECVRLLPGGPTHRPNNIWALGNTEQASMDNKGNAVYGKVIAPWNVQFTPNQALRPVNIHLGTQDFRNVIADKIPANTLLYSVQAKKSPCDQWDTIGEVYTRSEWIASKYGDTVMRLGQPYEQWTYAQAAPGVFCTANPDTFPPWESSEIALVEQQAQGSAPASIVYGNSPSAIGGASPVAGVGK